MTDWIELDPAHSTTRRLYKAAPEMVEEELKTTQKSNDLFETTLFQPEGEGRKGEGGLRTLNYFKKSSEEKPLITVITVVFNGEKHLEETILSVIDQTYDNVEYIIIDGGSTDRTLDIVQKYEHAIDYWVSEKDNGIYDAMNKGILLSAGSFFGFVNADDYLFAETLANIGEFKNIKKIDYTIGSVQIIDQLGIPTRIMKPINFLGNDKKIISYNMVTPHQAFYVNMLFAKKNTGLFNTKYSVSSDFDYVTKAALISKKYLVLPKLVGCYREGGVSGDSRTYFENYKILRSYGSGVPRSTIYLIRSLTKILIIRAFPKLVLQLLRHYFSSGRFEYLKK